MQLRHNTFFERGGFMTTFDQNDDQGADAGRDAEAGRTLQVDMPEEGTHDRPVIAAAAIAVRFDVPLP
jgi:hypothetical protein